MQASDRPSQLNEVLPKSRIKGEDEKESTLFCLLTPYPLRVNAPSYPSSISL